MSNPTCITVDVDQINQFDPIKSRNHIERVLELFDEYGVRGTFFICGESVLESQDLVKWIAQDHEVAAHGYFHRNLRKLKSHELRQEIGMAQEAFQRIGIECLGFRCPHFVIPSNLGQVLREYNFIYDSSQVKSLFIAEKLVYPFTNMKVDDIFEIPIQTFTALNLPLSLSSLRLLGPTRFVKYLPEKVNNFYFHSWELDRMGSASQDFSRRGNVVNQARMKYDLLKGYWDFVTGRSTTPADLTGRNMGEEAIKIIHILLKNLVQKKTRFITCSEWANAHTT
jgi:hypothetical protein